MFWCCKSLTSVTIGNSVTSISYAAFSRCKSLSSITIPDGITSIGNYAFENCSSLNEVFYKGTKEQWENLKDNSTILGNDYLFNANIIFNSLNESATTNKKQPNTLTEEQEVYFLGKSSKR